MGKTNKKAWPAAKVEMRRVSELTPYANNSRTHSPQQVDQIAASIREWGWTMPVLVDDTGMLIAGHGRILAAQKLGLEEVPTMTAVGWTEAQKKAYIIADNKLALNAEWDEEMLRLELEELDGMGFELELTGLDLDLDGADFGFDQETDADQGSDTQAPEGLDGLDDVGIQSPQEASGMVYPVLLQLPHDVYKQWRDWRGRRDDVEAFKEMLTFAVENIGEGSGDD